MATLSQHASARWVVLAGLWLVYMSFGLIVTSIAPLVAPIEADLGMSHAAMGSVMGAWQLVYIASAIPCGIMMARCCRGLLEPSSGGDAFWTGRPHHLFRRAKNGERALQREPTWFCHGYLHDRTCDGRSHLARSDPCLVNAPFRR